MRRSDIARKFIHLVSPLVLRAAIGELFRRFARWRRSEFIEVEYQISRITSAIPIIQNPLLVNNDNIGFEILIPSSLNHINLLDFSLKSLRRMYGDGLVINVLHQSSDQFITLKERGDSGNTTFINEEKFSKEIQELESSFLRYGTARRTWLMQQCLKTLFIAQSKKPTVILDADTTLTRPINFLANSRDLILIGSKEHSHFHMPYADHIKKFLGIQPVPMNFTHHCQLQRSDVVKEIYSEDVVSGLKKWLSLGVRYFEFSPVCEYQTYAEFLRTKHSNKTIFLDHQHHLVRVKKSKIDDFSDNAEIQMHLNNNCEGKCSLVTFAY